MAVVEPGGQRLCPWPEPENKISWVAEPQKEVELAVERRSVDHGQPFRSEDWTANDTGPP